MDPEQVGRIFFDTLASLMSDEYEDPEEEEEDPGFFDNMMNDLEKDQGYDG